MSKIWFITGANRGLGRQFTEAALSRGDRVVATGRNPDALQDLVSRYGDAVLPLQLDVTDREQALSAVNAAVDHFGRIDVVINNAGYGQFGMVEEVSLQQARDQMDVNFFGVLNVTQVVLPILRRQGAGHIIQISTIGGILGYPNLGIYNASKWAVEGLSDALAQEVAQFGIKVTLVEPGLFNTDWNGSSAVHAHRQPQYDDLRAIVKSGSAPPDMIGDPAAAGQAMLAIVDAAEPPLRVLFGKRPTQIVGPAYEQRLQTWKDWEHISLQANG